jgi:CheY-like chemotaxis protein
MAVAEPRPHISRVAVIDDDANDARTMGVVLRTLGMTPVDIAIDDRDLADVIADVKQHADAAICDHYLKRHARVAYTGAEAVARLTTERIPTCLITMYASDVDTQIRRWRSKIPVLLLRGAEIEEVEAGLAQCSAEIAGHPAAERVAYRTALSVERVSNETGEPSVDALVSGWHQDEAVRFPLSIIRKDLPIHDLGDLQGRVFFAMVNLGAKASGDLFFTDFESAVPGTLGEQLVKTAPPLDWGGEKHD